MNATKITHHFTYAVEIQPKNGQELNEFHGYDADDLRHFTANDRAKFPQAERQCHNGFCLVRDGGSVLKVAISELPEVF